MTAIRRNLAVALWFAGSGVLYDLGRTSAELLALPGAVRRLGEEAGLGLLVYMAAALALLTATRVILRPWLDTLAPGRASTRSPLCAEIGVATAAATGAVLISLLAERRSPAGFLTSSWLADAQPAFGLSLAAGAAAWTAVKFALECRRPGRALTTLGAIPVLLLTLPTANVLTGLGRSSIGSRTESAPAQAHRPNLVLVVVDALRADLVGPNESQSAPTPEMTALAKSGLRIGSCSSHAPEARAATRAILYGGVGPHPWTDPRLEARTSNLPETLRRHGYHTAAFVANRSISPTDGFAAGFERWETMDSAGFVERHSHALFARFARALDMAGPPGRELAAAQVMDRVIGFVESAPPEPWFVYIHLTDPTAPYQASKEMIDALDPGYEGKIVFGDDTLHRILLGEIPISERDLAHIRALYQAEVREVDRQIGRLAGSLGVREESASTTLVVTGSHGEEFLEHGWMGHGHSLHQELLDVPLLMAGHGIGPHADLPDAAVAHQDVAPTIVALAGLPPNPEFAGRNILELLVEKDNGAWRERTLLASTSPIGPGFRTSDQKSVSARRGRYKLILRESDVFGLGPWKKTLFDLAADPLEESPLDASGPEAELLEAQIMTWIQQDGGPVKHRKAIR